MAKNDFFMYILFDCRLFPLKHVTFMMAFSQLFEKKIVAKISNFIFISFLHKNSRTFELYFSRTVIEFENVFLLKGEIMM